MTDQQKAPGDQGDCIGPWGQKVLGWIERNRLQMPATLLLEMHRPLMPLAWSAAMLFGGFLAPLFGPEYYQKIEALRDPNLIDRFLDHLKKSTNG